MFNHSNFFAALLALLRKRNKKGGKGGKGGGDGLGGTGNIDDLVKFPHSKFDGRLIDAIDDALKRFD